MQPLQQLGFSVWPPYTPQIIFSIGTGSSYPYYPQPQVLPQLQPATTIPKDIDEQRTVSITVSVEDEEALINALGKRKEGGPTVQQVLKELSQKNGHAENVWEKWFIANFERLSSMTSLDRSVELVASERSTGSRCPIASRTQSKSRQRPASQCSTITLTNEPTRPHGRDESVSESESEQSSGGDDEFTYHNSQSSSIQVVQRHPRQHPRVMAGGRRTPPVHLSPFIHRERASVTDTDLRAMALYRFKKGDGDGLRRYRVAAWRGFAHRPENYLRRTLDAWINIPRKPEHAAAINRYVEEYRRVAEGANSVRRPVASPSGLRIRVDNSISQTGQRRATQMEHVSFGHVRNARPLRRRKVIRDVDPRDIIDLTVDSEVEE